jgi:hypothetical protein
MFFAGSKKLCFTSVQKTGKIVLCVLIFSTLESRANNSILGVY